MTTISLKRYVDITSVVGAAAAVSTRDLNARFYTSNHLVPTDSFVEFTSAADVGTYFGTDSDEYARAVFYFGWVSKSATTPNQLAFARWANAAVGSTIYGKVATYALGSFTSITTGDFTLTLGGFTHHLTAIDLHLAGSLAAVAAAVQAAIRAFSGGGTAWTSATVTYDATRKSFNLVSGATGADVIDVIAGVTTNLAGPLGWLTGAILSNGSAVETITEVLTISTEADNNFGSFGFVDTLTLDQITEAAEWNLTQNNMFLYSVGVEADDVGDYTDALAEIGGTTLTLSPLADEYPEQVPMMQAGATNYDAVNSVSNYMFQQFNLTPSVSSNSDADLYDGLRVNYYGVTQTSGQLIAFYQKGVMLGLPTSPSDQNVYVNEIWLKDALGAALMTLLLAQTQVPANLTGQAMILGILQGVINQGVTNGTISVGKALTDVQKSYVTTVSGDNTAWQQVQNQGYWVSVKIVTFVESLVTKYKAVYTLIYSKDDVIRKVEGSDILI